MSIYDAINAQPNALEQIKNNPAELLRRRGLSIPDGMNNPQQIIQHLITSGQIPQARYVQALQMMGRR